ncbi:unnamed protein product [Miscanthus lutarioriparius]|uniref:Transposase MuDR plant domain-containing protein n=1 Tax=Miscanthus lutarioriparius TaxID=422564 RepID=A0A811Q7J3_9POAL|nr:unnamed protein product [Miscanthus lutarioriparius]
MADSSPAPGYYSGPPAATHDKHKAPADGQVNASVPDGYYSGRPLEYDPQQAQAQPQATAGEQANGLLVAAPQPQPRQDVGEQVANHTHVHGVPGYYKGRVNNTNTVAAPPSAAPPAASPLPAPAAQSERNLSWIGKCPYASRTSLAVAPAPPSTQPDGAGTAAPRRGDRFLGRQLAIKAVARMLAPDDIVRRRRCREKRGPWRGIPLASRSCYDCGASLQAAESRGQGQKSDCKENLKNKHYKSDSYLISQDLVVYFAKDKDKHYVPVEDDEDEVESGSELGKSGSESESEIEEAEDLVGDDNEKGHVLDIEYDKEDPPMIEGTTYPNMATFKLALSHHAIKNEFEYRTVKSSPKRFTCICSRKNEDKCPWRIHASTTKDKQTIMVKDWLIDDATLGAKALQKKLKEHHKIWFMQLFKDAIGSPNGLAICIDAGQAIMNGVKEVFPQVEHRECMFHLVTNFKKKYHGKVFDDHLWTTAYSWNPYVFEKHWLAMEKEKPAATAYLRKCHTRLWTRS